MNINSTYIRGRSHFFMCYYFNIYYVPINNIERVVDYDVCLFLFIIIFSIQFDLSSCI